MAKKFVLLTSLLFSLVLFSSGAIASGLTFGAKTGPMQLDVSGVDDDPTNAGVAVGNEFGLVLGDLGVEAEFTTTMKDGSTNGNQDIDVDTMGIYATYRSPGFLYFKARTGFTHWEANVGNFSDDDTVTSMGLGLGFSLGIIQLELEYTEIDDDIDFISLGVVF